MPTLQITIPTKWQIHAKTVLAVLGAIPQVRGHKALLHVADRVSNLDQMRSTLLTRWADQAADDDVFLFLDSDQTLTGADVNALLDREGDVVIGVVGVGGNAINVVPVDPRGFEAGTDDRLLFGGAGVMLIRRPILRRVEAVLAELHGRARFSVPRGGEVAPYFLQRVVDGEWLAEDASFCWLVRRAGGTIRSVLSPTIGHEVMRMDYPMRGPAPDALRARG